MTQPISQIFRLFTSQARVQIWLYDQTELRIEGQIRGFDEYMNMVLEDAEEVNTKKETRKAVGRIMLKGENITLIMNTSVRRSNVTARLLCILSSPTSRFPDEPPSDRISAAFATSR